MSATDHLTFEIGSWLCGASERDGNMPSEVVPELPRLGKQPPVVVLPAPTGACNGQ